MSRSRITGSVAAGCVSDTTSQRIAWATAAALLLSGLVLALPAQARPGHGHHGWGGPGSWTLRHAEELGIDAVTRAEIEAIVEASRAESEAIDEERREAREALHELLAADEPDVDAALEQAEVVGEIDTRRRQQRIQTMLAVRAKLSPEQRAQLRALKDERRESFGEGRGAGCPHCGKGGEAGAQCSHAGESCPYGCQGEKSCAQCGHGKAACAPCPHGAESCPHHESGGEQCRGERPPPETE